MNDPPTTLDDLLGATTKPEGCDCIVSRYTDRKTIESVDMTVADLIDAILVRRDAGSVVSTIRARSAINEAFGVRVSESTLNRHARFCLGRRSWATP